jgi:hypothetical protein
MICAIAGQFRLTYSGVKRIRLVRKEFVMLPAEEQLRFVVRFAGLDLNHLRPGDWLNLRDDFQVFLDKSTSGIMVRAAKPPFPADYTEDDFRALQQEVRELLTDIVATRGRESYAPSTPVLLRVIVSVVVVEGLFPGRPNALMIEGLTRDVFLWLVTYLLARESIDCIALCPECQTIFYRNRNQLYCTRRCVNRVNQRNWRAEKRHPA